MRALGLGLGKRLGLDLPHQIDIFAIEIADASTFSEECTPEVRHPIRVCLDMVVRELGGTSISN